MKDVNKSQEKAFLKKVEKAARKGVTAGENKHLVIRFLIVAIAVAGFLFWGVKKLEKMAPLEQVKPVAGHDMTIENKGILGFTTADFEKAILGESKQLKKLEVFEQEISDQEKYTQAGFAKLKAFSKYQTVTFYGKAIYVIDLSSLSEQNVKVDHVNRIVTIKIPHAVLDKIHVSSDEIEFGEVEHGIFSVGKVKTTPEGVAEVQTEAVRQMELTLEEEKINEKADKEAVEVIKELYGETIKKISPRYLLEVEFTD